MPVVGRFVLHCVRKRARSLVVSEIGFGTRLDRRSIRAALRILERDEREYEAKLTSLRRAIDEGDVSGIAKGDVFARVRKTLHLPKSSR